MLASDAFVSGVPLWLRRGGSPTPEATQAAVTWDTLEFDRSMELLYADQFSVDYDQGGYAKLTIGDADTYLVVPEGAAVPSRPAGGVTVLQQPLDSVYLVATSAMDLFRELDAMDAIRLSGTDASGWYIQEAKQAMEEGRMTYAGKYSAPDYELILASGCDLAVESTMIYHTPEVKEQLEKLGIPVLVERSSYESHPPGKDGVDQALCRPPGKGGGGRGFFDSQMEKLTPILGQENTGKTVAFFYITSNGAVNVRKSGDYIAKSISLAGGVYALQDLTADDSAMSTMNMQMESFFAAAKDADILIYNSTIDGELQTMDQLLQKSDLLKNFKAVQEGRVWCTGKNLFQESLGLGDLIADIHTIVTAEDGESLDLTYLHPLS